jgi:peptidoglycan/LPS O-acetylase OafA/YrhL
VPAFVPALEGWRGYASVMVVCYHCMVVNQLPLLDDGFGRALLIAGFMGVNFFFVISGFRPASGSSTGSRRSRST